MGYRLVLTLRSHAEPVMEWWQSGNDCAAEAHQIFDGGIALVKQWIALHPPSPTPTEDTSPGMAPEDRKGG